jgi:arginine-tRNA-protein transferase
MNSPYISQQPSLAFYASAPHECGYLPGRQAVTVFADPDTPIETAAYSQLINFGFRRSGSLVYRPQCPGCQACVSVRVDVNEFTPDRSQRRNTRRNQDLTVVATPAEFVPEHFEIYCRYLASRHRGGGMDNPSAADYMGFLTSPNVDTGFYELRLDDALLGVMVVDHLTQGLSAVYTFFDPEYPQRGLGTFAILWQIREAGRRGLPWVYLGYWVADCEKMAYKNRFRPFEAYINGRWQPGDTATDRDT